MQIYVVVSGYYSDYTIEALFTSLEKAKNYCQLYNDAKEDGVDDDQYDYRLEYRIKTMETDPETPQVPKDLRGFRVFVSKDGETAVTDNCPIAEAQKRRYQLEFFDPDKTKHNLGPFCVHSKSPLDRIRLTRVPSMKLWVLARDEPHAIKIGSEKRAEILAFNRWPTESDSYGRAESLWEKNDNVEED